MNEFHRDEKRLYRNLYYSGLSGAYHAYQHRMLESFARESYDIALEVGAGNGEHADFLRSEFGLYVAQDLIEPSWSDVVPDRLKFVQSDVQHLPFANRCFDRIVLGCVLHHVGRPIRALQEIRRVADVGCHLTLLLPCDPGLLYRAVRHVTVHRRLRQRMSQVEVLRRWAELHPNNVLGILSLIRSEFQHDRIRIRRRPLPALPWNMNLFFVVDIWIREST